MVKGAQRCDRQRNIVFETATVAALGIALLSPWLQSQFGLTLSLSEPTLNEWLLMGSLLVAGWLASLLPGIRAYRLSLADGLSPRI